MIGDGTRSAVKRVRAGEKVRITDTARCPYCARTIVLGDCPIVATETVRSGGSFGYDDAEVSARPQPVSGTPVTQWAGDDDAWPVLAPPPAHVYAAEPKGRMSRLTQSVPVLEPVEAVAPFEDLPARLCPACQEPLPGDIDSRELLTIAVVGMTGATKTHYLGSMLWQAANLQALSEPLSCAEFAPDEPSAERFHNDYYLELFTSGEPLPATALEEEVRLRPLAFRATFRDHQPRTLLFHDVAGEVLTSRAVRNRVAPFVRRADGIVFLVDPAWYPPVAQYLRQHRGIDVGPVPYNQATLLAAVADELQRDGVAEEIPVAVALSKADLLAGAFGRSFGFDAAPPLDRAGWLADMNAVSDEVGALLDELHAPDLVAATHRFGDVTFHAVAPLGFQPSPDVPLTPGDIAPRRCLDPLVSVLVRQSNSAI